MLVLWSASFVQNYRGTHDLERTATLALSSDPTIHHVNELRETIHRSEAEVGTLKMEDVGDGQLDLRYGSVYRMKVKITFDVFNALSGHTETAICSVKIE